MLDDLFQFYSMDVDVRQLSCCTLRLAKLGLPIKMEEAGRLKDRWRRRAVSRRSQGHVHGGSALFDGGAQKDTSWLMQYSDPSR